MDEKEESLRAALRSALAGESILFLGAGASKDAFDKKGISLPTGQQLADFLAKECKLDAGYPLDTITEHFIEETSETRLINTLRRVLHVEKIGLSLTSLGSLKWLRVWTTNYDDSFEKALEVNKTKYFSLTSSDDVINARGSKFVVFHINGKLSKIKQTITSDFILTSQSYATQSFIDSDWATIFRNDIQQCKSIIFIGYSLADIDVARIVFSPETFFRKVHFIDYEKLDPVLNTKLSKFGTVHPIGLKKFTDILIEEKENWVPIDKQEEYKSWQQITIEDNLCKPTDDDFYDLILKGVTKDGLILNQLETPNDPTYTIIRSFEEKCIRHLGENNSISALIGSFASGKTTALRSIALKLVAEGRDVFILDHPYESARIELQKLCRRDSDFILILENYSRNLDLVECFCLYAKPECNLIISERTEIHELLANALSDRSKNRNLELYDLDILENDELDRLAALLDLRGMWGERAALGKIQRLAFLKEDCSRQMQAILIELIKSPEIKKRLSEIVTHFESIDGGLRILIGFCVLQAIGEQPRIDVTAELLNLTYETFSKLSKDDITRQIVSVQSGIAHFRSPVIAMAVLNGIRSAAVITEVVEECIINGHKARKADPYLGDISKELIRFGNLERMLPSNGKRIALKNLYEEIKNIPSIRNNPQFWLQYAMSRLSLGDIDTARKYFADSYSYAKKIKGYDTFQIDNHYCRLLLRDAEDATDSDEAFKATDDALAILKRQVLRENRHYPYRSVWSLEGVAKRHANKWTKEQRNLIISASKYIVDAASRLEPNVARSTAVIGGLQRLTRVIDILS